MEKKTKLQDRNSLTFPVAAAAVLFSSTILLPVNTAPAQALQPPSLNDELPPITIEYKSTEPELNPLEEKQLFNRIMKEIKAEQEKLQLEAEARQKALQAESKLRAAKAKAPKTVSRKMDNPVMGLPYSEVTNYALNFQGVPYKYGGTNPTTGLDCSAFTKLVFGNFGIDLPRTAAQQFRIGEGIAREGLQPGDLVFFSTNGPGASHVGIYLGNGKFISTTTKGVRVEDMNDNYWGKYYRGSRRVK